MGNTYTLQDSLLKECHTLEDVKPMDEKLSFLADHLRGIGNFRQLCERHGISRKSNHKRIDSHLQAGLDGLAERSHRHLHPVEEITHAIRRPSWNCGRTTGRTGDEEDLGLAGAPFREGDPPPAEPASTTPSRPPARSKHTATSGARKPWHRPADSQSTERSMKRRLQRAAQDR